MLLRRFVRSVLTLRNYSNAAKNTAPVGRILVFEEEEVDSHFSDPGTPRVAITKDKSTIVMYHPRTTAKYEDSIPVPRDDPRYTTHENIESLVREKLDDLGVSDKPLDKATIEKPWPIENKETIPTIMHLANMFYTTKHIWFPRSKLRNKKEITPDRPRE